MPLPLPSSPSSSSTHQQQHHNHHSRTMAVSGLRWAKIEAVNLSQHKHKKHNKRPGTSIKERDEQVVWSIPEPPVRQPSVESSNLEKPDNPPIVTMDDNRTMAQLLR
ncbi:hypothetical protein Tco_0194841 [Tanacetum coccineum]